MENVNTLKTSATAPQQTKYAKVLLLDDNPLDNFVNKKLLEINRFAGKIDLFETGAGVLAYLKKETEENLPDIIFLDIMMPGMDGFQFLEAFEMLSGQVHKKCKIIMLSTSDSFKDLNRANKCRFVYKFLNKPLNEQVLAAINF